MGSSHGGVVTRRDRRPAGSSHGGIVGTGGGKGRPARCGEGPRPGRIGCQHDAGGLPFVRALATSFLRVHPEGHVSALVFDDVDGVVSEGEPFEVVRLDDLPEGLGELHRMAAIYDVGELATALKP